MTRSKVTVTQSDTRRETFRGSGAGGQNRNKRETGVRFTHLPSGAVGECCEERSQVQNERTAWRRMAESPKFKTWAAAELAAREEGFRSVEAKVDRLMADENLRVEAGSECAPGEDYCDR